MKKMSLQWRLTCIITIYIAVICGCLTMLVYKNGVYYIDSLKETVDTRGDEKADDADEIYISIPEDNWDEFANDFSVQVYNNKTDYRKNSLIISAVLALLGGVATYFISGHALRPIREFSDKIEEVQAQDQDKMILHIDPGTAFGTGMHDTTQLCIRQLKKYITPETVLLDVGTGSGILSILSLMFGAKKAVGTDLDPCAVEAVKDNMEANHIDPSDFTMMIGNIITEKEVQDKVGYECYDIVAANILAEVLQALTPVIVSQLKPGGIYITSGIIDDKEQVVRDAVKAAGLKLLEVTYQGEWVSVTAQKPLH